MFGRIRARSDKVGRDRNTLVWETFFVKVFSKFELEWWKVIFESEIFESCSQAFFASGNCVENKTYFRLMRNNSREYLSFV